MKRDSFFGKKPDGSSQGSASFSSRSRLPPANFLEPPGSSAFAGLGSLSDGSGLVGQCVSTYEIRRIIGRGAGGVVYEAWQPQPGRSVALKTLRQPVWSDAMLRRFEHEARALGRLTHPNIAQIFEADADGDPPFFAMELVEGLPLIQFARERKLDLRTRVRLLIDICRAVEHAHQRGVIHRDLKPANILVTEAGRPKVLDFGVARLADADLGKSTRETHAGDLIGTIPYMSPEQCAGDPDAIDTRCDVYALGVIGYELLAGRLPYDVPKGGIPAVVGVIRDAPPLPPSMVRPELRGDLSVILLKALDKEPAHRYQTASALADDLQRYLRNEPIVGRPPSAGYHLRKFVARHRAAVGLSLALLVVVVAAGGLAVFQNIRLASERNAALAAKEREENARASAEQVTSFLEQMFEQADPDAQSDKIPDIRDILELGASRLEGDLKVQPLVRARLGEIMGYAYHRLGDLPRSRELLEGAVSLRREDAGGNPLRLAESLELLAQTLATMGEHEQAANLRREKLDLIGSQFGESSGEYAMALNDFGAGRFYAGDHEAAVEYFQRALELRRGIFGEESEAVAESMHNLGGALLRSNRLDEANTVLLEALETRRRLLGDDPKVTRTLSWLAHTAHARRDLAASEQYLSEQVAMSRRLYGDTHIRVAWALHDLAFVVRQSRGAEHSEPLFREALEIRRKILGENHPEVAASLSELAETRKSLNDLAGAISLYEEALRIHRKAFGGSHDTVAHTLRNTASTYCLADRQKEAIPLLEESYAIFSRNHGAAHETTGIVATMLAKIHEMLGEQSEASRWAALASKRAP